MLEESIFNFIIALYAIIANIIFAISCRKRRDLLLWLFGTTGFAAGSVFIYLQAYGAFYYTIGNSFYLIALIFLVLFVSKEYHQTFLKKEEYYDSNKNRNKYAMIFLSMLSITLIAIQVIMIIVAVLAIFMLLRIYLRKRTITRLFMFFTILTGLLTLILRMLFFNGLEDVWELGFVTYIIMISFFLTTGLAIPIEDRINTSEEKYIEAYTQAEFYKDLFAHDISNILQYVKSSLDLIKMYQEEPQGKNQIDKVINILNEQTIRGSKLVKNVRTLSELSEIETEIKIKPINLINTLNDGVDYIKKTYPDRDLYISINPSEGDFFVEANKFFLNVIENLFINAIKYNINPNIDIQVEISPTKKNGKKYLKLEFKDNGIGVSNQLKKTLFKTVVRKEGKPEGMGLNLLLVKRILDSYNAEIWVEDRIIGDPPKGSNFIIQIPEGS